MYKKVKISLVLSFCFIFILGIGLSFLLLQPNIKASTSSARLFGSNLLLSSNYVNKSNLDTLNNLLNRGSSVMNYSQLKSLNGGRPIIFPFCDIPSNNNILEFEVVYKNGDIITVMATKPYSESYFYRSARYADYSNSTLRTNLNSIFNTLNSSYSILDSVVLSPSEAGQTYQQGDDTYNRPTQFRRAVGQSTYYTHHNGLLYETDLDRNYVDIEWNESNPPYYDKFWAPSYYEVWNSGNGSATNDNNTDYFDGGYWGFDSYEDLAIENVLLQNGSTDGDNFYFLRSSYNGQNDGVLLIRDDGVKNYGSVNTTCGIRIACHLSLSALANYQTDSFYTVTFDKQGGTGGADYVDVIRGEEMPNASAPTKPNATFAGYFTQTGGQGVQYYSSSMTSARDWDMSADDVLYAYWIAPYTLSFDSNGGSSVSDKIVNSGQAIGTLTTPTRTGYSFSGWYIGSTRITSTTIWNYTSNQTAVARWSARSYTVTFDYNGATGNNSTATKTVRFDSTYGTLPSPTRTGYTFDGWYRESDFSTLITSSTQVTNPANHTLYAKWRINSYYVSVNVLPENSGSVSGEGTYNYNEQISLTAQPNSSYQFVNWTDEDGQVLGTDLTYSFNMPANDIIINANFRSTEILVKATLGGEVRVTGYDRNSSSDVTLSAIAYTGYTFEGWAIESNNSLGYEILSNYTNNYVTIPISEALGKTYMPLFRDNSTNAIDTAGNVTVRATLGGEIRMGCYDTSSTNAMIHISAVTSKGFEFVNWTTLDGIELDSYTMETIEIPLSLVSEKTIIANFQKFNNSNVNDDVNN